MFLLKLKLLIFFLIMELVIRCKMILLVKVVFLSLIVFVCKNVGKDFSMISMFVFVNELMLLFYCVFE